MSDIQLNQQALSSVDESISTPSYDRTAIKTGIVHIGVGGFHRAHQAYYIHLLLEKYKNYDWGICGLGLRDADRKMKDALLLQDGLYTLITQHPDGHVHSEIIGSIPRYILAADQQKEAQQILSSPDTKIVTLTITEGGYNFNPTTGEFNFENEEVQHDLLNPNQLKTVFGYLTAALTSRREKGIPPFTVLSCDNIQHNGDVARKMLLAFVQRQNPDLLEWIRSEVTFPNSMVDRITPVTTPSDIQYLSDTHHLNDRWPVVCEPFIQWVIEDNFCNGRPPLEKLGVQFVPDVTPYEKMKIRLLNAGHSILGIPGAIHGHPTIDACMGDNVFSAFMRAFMDKEATPVVGEVEGINLKEYKDNLESRFANPNIKDGVSRICSESSAKLPKFLIPTILENLESGGSILYGTFILAAWCYYSDKGVDRNSNPIEIIDQRKDELHAFASNSEADEMSFLRIKDIFGDLSNNERFLREYKQSLNLIYQNPDVRSHMQKMISS